MKLRITDKGLVETELSTSQLFKELCKNAVKPLCEYEPWVSDSFQRLILNFNVLLPTLDHDLYHLDSLFTEPAIGSAVVLVDAPAAAVGAKMYGYVFYLRHLIYHANGGSFSVEYYHLCDEKMQPYFNSYERKKTIDGILETL